MIEVVDRIMGGYKTTDAINHMNDTNEKFMYVTPFLAEVDRVLKEVWNCSTPNNWNTEGSKRVSLLDMANKGRNIVATHALFKMLVRDDYSYFYDYELILDEVVDPIEVMDITTDDIHMLIATGKIVINSETSVVSFTESGYDGTFTYLKQLCATSNVVYVNDTFLVWNFPIEIFKSFKSVKILTYLFEGSILSSYFKYSDIEYTLVKDDDSEKRAEIREKLNVYIGSEMSERTKNLFGRKFKTGASENAFTTFKDFQSQVKGGGYATGFIAVNSRATNNFSHKKSMAYFANRYMNPNVVKFFYDGGVSVNQDLWALGELLQWVWRGNIRNKENNEMNLYVPSKRMRNLLMNWLNE